MYSLWERNDVVAVAAAAAAAAANNSSANVTTASAGISNSNSDVSGDDDDNVLGGAAAAAAAAVDDYDTGGAITNIFACLVCPSADDESTFEDYDALNHATSALRRHMLAYGSSVPFFLALGICKPHTPWRCVRCY